MYHRIIWKVCMHSSIMWLEIQMIIKNKIKKIPLIQTHLQHIKRHKRIKDTSVIPLKAAQSGPLAHSRVQQQVLNKCSSTCDSWTCDLFLISDSRCKCSAVILKIKQTPSCSIAGVRVVCVSPNALPENKSAISCPA